MNIVIAISSFRSDQQTIELINQLYNKNYTFNALIIVISQSSGAIEEHIKRLQYNNCHVYNFSENLGSAGNLHQRFLLSEKLGGDYMLALNHDASINKEMFNALVNTAKNSNDNIGALYPLRYRSGKRIFDLTGTKEFPFSAFGSNIKPKEKFIEVFWSSSNGALYSLKPTRKGIIPDASLWMGWEDYLYGLVLKKHRYKQYIVTTAQTTDNYEYKFKMVLGKKITISDKAVWYSYYGPRNFILIHCHRNFKINNFIKLFYWLLRSPLQVILSKSGDNEVIMGLKYLILGIIHGFYNKSGKWNIP